MQLGKMKMTWLEIYIHIGPSIISNIMISIKKESNWYPYLSKINYLYSFLILKGSYTKISLAFFPIGPRIFVWHFGIFFTRARIQIMMTMTILSTHPFGSIISLFDLIQACILCKYVFTNILALVLTIF